MKRPTNQELCDEFRKLLTECAKTFASNFNNNEEVLRLSKPWRGELWAKFAEIERRLCPQPPEN